MAPAVCQAPVMRDVSRRRRLLGPMVVLSLVLAACGYGYESTIGADEGEPGVTVTTTMSPADEPGTSSTVAGADSSTTASPAETTGAPEPGAPLQGLALEQILADESLHQPTYATAPEGDDRLFVLERVGRIRIVDPDQGLLDDSFLNIAERVSSNGIERGLLGLAFHPDYAENGRFFVYHTDLDGRRRLAEYTVSADDPDRGDLDSERVLFALEQPAESSDIRHYGGMLKFGPDGMLYVSSGDGADFRNQGQNPETLFGVVMRLDVDSDVPYGIPPDNPFVGGGGAGEVFVYGLRNPWRISIDPVEGLLYIADVGQGNWEEVNVLPLDQGGANMGWYLMEGTHCYTQECDPTGLTLPVIEYDHEDGCSVTGGHPYRGEAIPELHGVYFYSDWCGQWVRSFRYVDGEATEQTDWSEDLPEAGQVNAFGVDGAGELYILNFAGALYKIVPVR